VADREREEELRLDLDPALLASAALAGRDDHVVARGGHDPPDLDLEVVPLVRPDAERLAHAVVPVLLGSDAGGGDLGRLHDPDVLRAEGEDRSDVVAVVGLEGLDDHLDVRGQTPQLLLTIAAWSRRRSAAREG